MRSIRGYVYALLAVVVLWQCLASARPVAAADHIKFFVTNTTGNKWKVRCDGPWLRSSSFKSINGNVTKNNFYTAEVSLFSPFGEWTCGYYDFENQNIRLDEQTFCIFDTPFVNDAEINIDIPFGTRVNHPLPLRITGEVSSCPAQLPPPALIQLSGSATKVGNSSGHSTVSLSGKFTLTEPLALDLATITIAGLLNEVEGAGELVAGLPLVLAAKSGSTANAATYQSVPNTLPRVRLDVTKRSPETKPVEFRLKVEDALIAQYPQYCSEGPDSTTPLALRFTIDDGVNLPFVVESEVAWTCLGSNPQMPTALKVQRLLPIELDIP